MIGKGKDICARLGDGDFTRAAIFSVDQCPLQNRPILSCSAFPRGEIELDCPVKDSLTSTVNNTMDEKVTALA